MNFPTYGQNDYANDIRIHADYDWASRLIEVRLIHYQGLGGRTVTVGAPVEMRQYDEAQRVPPTLELRPEAAQQLMDALWQCGLRPTEGTGSAGALAATQKHLDDMRALVFKSPLLTKEPVVK
jgi:hypothetical protein